MDIRTEKTETPTEKTIHKDQPFIFFSNDSESTPTEIKDSHQIEGLGRLSGIASQEEAQGRQRWLAEFNMVIAEPTPKTSTAQPIEGDPTQNLILFVNLKSSSGTEAETRASLGTISKEKGRRVVKFDRWHQVDEDISKIEFITDIAARPGNSLVFPDGSYVRYSEFKLV